MANNINMARLSISSPSKPTPSVGFGSSPGSYRTLNHLGTESNYYSNEVVSSNEGFYEREGPNMSDIGGCDLQQSPQQTQQPQSQQASFHQTQYFGGNFNNSSSGPSSARQSFSGPASPHHQSMQYHHSGAQYSQQYHHHQLPPIPNKLTYSSSGYLLNSPGASSPMQMYHHMHPSGPNEEENGDANNANASANPAEEYAAFSARYKLKV